MKFSDNPNYIPPVKVLDYKTYPSIGHLSGSRLGESDSTIDMNTELKMTQKFPNKYCELIVQEKMDGANVCVVRFNNEIRALSRSGFDCAVSSYPHHNMFHRYVMKNKEFFNALLPNEHDRIVGEWCALAHGTIYKDIKVPFYVFDLYRNKEQKAYLDLYHEVTNTPGNECVTFPNLLWRGGPLSIDRALEMLSEKSPDGEGVIYRLQQKDKHWIIAKVVKQDKVGGKYLEVNEYPERIWNWKE